MSAGYAKTSTAIVLIGGLEPELHDSENKSPCVAMPGETVFSASPWPPVAKSLRPPLQLVASLFLEERPGAPSSVLAPSSRPGAPSSVLAPVVSQEPLVASLFLVVRPGAPSSVSTQAAESRRRFKEMFKIAFLTCQQR